MRTMAVGTRWDLAEVPLPAAGPIPDRPSLGCEVGLEGLFVPDESRDPVLVEVADRAGEARWLAAMSARYDQRLADTYLRGAAEFAARSCAPTETQRREWGARGMVAELACALRLPETTLARRLTRITMLRECFPRLADAAASGLVSSWHCDVVLDAFAGVTDPAVLERADAALLERATSATAAQLGASARRWRARHVPRSEEQRRAALRDRRVELSPADEDMVWLSALIPVAQGVAIDRRLDALAAAAAGEPDEDRTAAQVRADALVDLLLDPAAALGAGEASEEGEADRDERSDGRGDGAVDAGRCVVPGWVRGVRAELVLTVPVLSLLGHSDEPAELEGFGPIDLETARLLAATAPSFTRVLTDPETGAVLSVGRDRYRLPADLRRAVQLRDQTCRFPGCRRRARGCEVDHSTAWEHGGSTEICNLACLCKKHHRLKHELSWTAAHEPGGVLRWRSPVGRRYRTEPGTLWPPPPSPSLPTSTPPRTPPPPSTPPSTLLPAADAGDGGPPGGSEAASPSSAYPDEPPF